MFFKREILATRKSQIPTSKSQTIFKLLTSKNAWHPLLLWGLEIRICDFLGIWNLGFGTLVFGHSLGFMKSYWLVKQEPSDYSWSDFVSDGGTSWTGVRNFAARNNLRRMSKADKVLFYHSGDSPSPSKRGATSQQLTKAVVGIAKVVRTAYRDSTAKEGDWSAVDLAPVRPLRRGITLAEIKATPALKNVALVRQSRLSVMPLGEKEFEIIVTMGGL